MKATDGRIWEAASKDESRPVLTLVKFDAEAATLTATNSYIAARVPCEVEEGDESGLIPAAAIKEAAGRSLRIADGKATLTLPDGVRMWTLGSDAFPDIEKILDEYEAIAAPFGVNHDLLRQLGVALGCGGKSFAPLVLHPVSPLRGMRVTHGSTTERRGVLMPVRLNGYDPPPAVLRPDVTNDDAVIAGVRAAAALLEKKRGKAKAAQAFRDAALAAAEGASA